MPSLHLSSGGQIVLPLRNVIWVKGVCFQASLVKASNWNEDCGPFLGQSLTTPSFPKKGDLMKNQMLVAENRSVLRINDHSRLYIRGFNTFGLPFSEVSKIIDISEAGISWLMDSPVEVDSVLYLDISYTNPKDPHPILRRKAKARGLATGEP